jgi:hypothetical protein
MSDSKDSLVESYNFRISRKLKMEFLKKSRKFGKSTDILREIVEAFVDDRLVIHPNPKKESLYVNRTTT